MPTINITQRGSFDNTEAYLQRLLQINLKSILTKYGEIGVTELSKATPKDSGDTAHAWYFEVVQRSGYSSVRWFNSHVQNGRPIAILLQYGHGTRNGGWVEGRDYINPAIRPVFDKIVEDVMKEVVK